MNADLSVVAAPPGEPSDDANPPSPDTRIRYDRLAYWAVGALTVLPILINAIRAGLNGWIPTNDAAAAVLRAKYSLGAHPTWLGLYAYPSSHAIDATTYTAGPWQLWWMSVPVKVLGVTWGPLLSMAVLNSAFLLLAAWCVKRRLGYRSAIGTLVFLSLLIWSFGADAFHSPVPVVAVAAPFAAFCFAAWALASGDEGVLPVVAGLASYLVLGHPSTTLLVPVIGLSALAFWIVWFRGDRRRNPRASGERVRRAKRLGVISVVITVVLWIPSLIQEFTTDPGNLTHLYRASNEMASWMSFRRSVASTFALFTGTPFWLRGSTEHSFLTFTAGIPSLAATVLAAVFLAAAFVLAGIVAYRSGDRPALSAVGLGVCATVANWLHFLRSPHGQYFLPIWVVAMFASFAIVYALVRALPDRLKRPSPVAAVVVVAVLAVINVPDRPIPHFTASNSTGRSITKELDARIIPAVRDRGTVTIAPAFNGTYRYAAGLVVALDDAGIPVCGRFIVSFQGYRNPACDHTRPGVIVTYRSAANLTSPPKGETVVARHVTLTPTGQRDWKDLSLKVWGGVNSLAESGAPLPLTEEYLERRRTGYAPKIRASTTPDFVDDPGLINSDFSAQAAFARAITRIDSHYDGQVALARLPGVDDAELLRWARLRSELAKGVVVTVKPQS